MNMNLRVAPSLLSADFARLGDEIARAALAGADYIHVDVMDGHFVPNITIGPPVVRCLRRATNLPLDVHLMIDRPDIYAPQFADAGANFITIHVESPSLDSSHKISSLLTTIRSLGVKPGIVLKPRTPADAAFPYLDLCDMVLVMTVEPGFGGQAFMHNMLPKIAALRAEAQRRNLALDIEVDGGIDLSTAQLCCAHGANVFVAGTFLFGQSDQEMAARIAALHNLSP
ncbi:MAG: ribulose-phosphate 3-epimerase [bacterium]|nr:ribulose-phosphate 3-epimerase [bacterium]